ncbi:hypothetical protein [Pedobacter nanyangensis]|uniref:hypothetical protein n=1 Tax=Pedobacter nanyangensis TaxID=1562389 RepID=UPI000DE31245|nr:hypothetical protein [Pedobacter nanyangensis]
MKTLTPTFESFQEFYIEFVAPLKNNNPEYIRLDGQTTGSTRGAAAYFKYRGNKWKVDADTQIDKLKIAFELLQRGEDPFLIKPTQNNTGECLIIKEQPLRNKKFYVYKIV